MSWELNLSQIEILISGQCLLWYVCLWFCNSEYRPCGRICWVNKIRILMTQLLFMWPQIHLIYSVWLLVVCRLRVLGQGLNQFYWFSGKMTSKHNYKIQQKYGFMCCTSNLSSNRIFFFSCKPCYFKYFKIIIGIIKIRTQKITSSPK